MGSAGDSGRSVTAGRASAITSTVARAIAASLPALLVASLMSLAGCAANPRQGPLYHWGDYQRRLYEYLKGDETTPAEQLDALQAQAERARASGAALAPGFRAQLALLYLQLGRDGEATAMIEAEKAAFPESTLYMDFVLGSIAGK